MQVDDRTFKSKLCDEKMNEMKKDGDRDEKKVAKKENTAKEVKKKIII